MKTPRLLMLCFFSLLAVSPAAEDVAEKRQRGAEKVAADQDELSADVQQLALEQTVPKVIELLNEVEGIMDEATDRLLETDTGGETIAAQTEVIEKIHEAAKERQKSQGGDEASGAMMDMLERMMGREPGKPQEGEAQPGETPGTGRKGGESDSDNGVSGEGEMSESVEERRVPKASGTAGRPLPAEFQKALDAYNRGLEGRGK